MTELIDVLRAAESKLSQDAKEMLSPLFVEERLALFADRLLHVHRSEGMLTRHPPTLDDESTPESVGCYAHFRVAIQSWESDNVDAAADQFVVACEQSETRELLSILGQRTTPGSLVDQRAFPPGAEQLIQSASSPNTEGEELSNAARALAKHASRQRDEYWKQPSGSPTEQNEVALGLVQRMRSEMTWWNIFEHFQHGPIYEIRIPSGHGARWSNDGSTFIGFVDPFDSSARLDSHSENRDAVESKDFPPLPEHLDRDELVRRFEQGQRDFTGADLSAADLQNLTLGGIILRNANLRKAKLFGTSFKGADLTESDLSGTYLAKAELSGAKARRTNFHGCRMDGVSWDDVDLQSARLTEVNLRNATLNSCVMKSAGLKDADLTNLTLHNVRLYGIFAEETCWHGAQLTECRLNNGRLAKADLAEARFERCRFESANLSGATCQASHFERCDFVEADLSGADFTDCHLEQGRFERTNLSGTRLEGTRMANSQAVRANFSRANLNKADLSGSNLSQADLYRADLRNATLNGTILEGADLSSADVVDTHVNEATVFTAAKTTGVDFGTNWSLRQQVLDSAHELTIQHFRRKHPILGFLWWTMLGCGRHPSLLLAWGVVIVVTFAGLMSAQPLSFDFGHPANSFLDHLQNSLAVFVTLDLAVDKGTDTFGRAVMLIEMLLSYLMLGFMASLFSGIFPSPPE